MVSTYTRFVGILLMTGAVVCAEEPGKTVSDELTMKRYQLMEKRMSAVRVTSSEEGFPMAFESKPIFRYTDPARQYVAAAIWKLGAEGRPKAFMTTELHRSYRGQPRIVYEYLSLTPLKFAAVGGDVAWRPTASAVEFQPIPGAPTPEATPQRRLLQMRALAKQFAGKETVGNERCELRLLPQPIDRYTPSTADRADGAMFLQTYGTNPEIALFIESDGQSWTFAAGRLAGASRIDLTIEGKTVWEGAPVNYALTSPYTASNSPADIPGISPDGAEIINK